MRDSSQVAVEPDNEDDVELHDGVQASTSAVPRASCHHCKTSKPLETLRKCSAPTSKRGCRKKYCLSCLKRSYPNMDHTVDFWTCPACINACVCAGCKRKNAPSASSQQSDAPSAAAASQANNDRERAQTPPDDALQFDSLFSEPAGSSGSRSPFNSRSASLMSEPGLPDNDTRSLSELHTGNDIFGLGQTYPMSRSLNLDGASISFARSVATSPSTSPRMHAQQHDAHSELLTHDPLPLDFLSSPQFYPLTTAVSATSPTAAMSPSAFHVAFSPADSDIHSFLL